MLYHHTVMIKE